MPTKNAQNVLKASEAAYSKLPKVSSELLTLTYGVFIQQIFKTTYRIEDVNAKLLEIGQNMGLRIVDDFLSHIVFERCSSFTETCQILVGSGFMYFFGVSGTILSWNEENSQCVFLLKHNLLNNFVEIPAHLEGLKYNNMLCGVIKGALNAINFKVKVEEVESTVYGANDDVFSISLEELLHDETGE
ncbi:hypothetical protein PCE1_002983 [Barthelona sp. PCE]